MIFLPQGLLDSRLRLIVSLALFILFLIVCRSYYGPDLAPQDGQSWPNLDFHPQYVPDYGAISDLLEEQELPPVTTSKTLFPDHSSTTSTTSVISSAESSTRASSASSATSMTSSIILPTSLGDEAAELRRPKRPAQDPVGRSWKSGAIVAAARATEDIKWMDDLSTKWSMFPYNVDAWFPSPHLRIPTNKGHEAMVYLTFIIDHWDDLPPRSIFVHGHRKSWHQDDIVKVINHLQFGALESEGYISLRCDWYPSCPIEIRPLAHDTPAWGPGANRHETEDAIAEAWDQLFPGVEIPETISSPCCAQFAVTREAIRRRTLADYERMRNWLLDTTLADDISGRVFEKLWAYIMTDESVHCPAPQRCACEFFNHCDLQKWSTPPKGFPLIPEW